MEYTHRAEHTTTLVDHTRALVNHTTFIPHHQSQVILDHSTITDHWELLTPSLQLPTATITKQLHGNQISPDLEKKYLAQISKYPSQLLVTVSQVRKTPALLTKSSLDLMQLLNQNPKFFQLQNEELASSEKFLHNAQVYAEEEQLEAPSFETFERAIPTEGSIAHFGEGNELVLDIKNQQIPTSGSADMANEVILEAIYATVTNFEPQSHGVTISEPALISQNFTPVPMVPLVTMDFDAIANDDGNDLATTHRPLGYINPGKLEDTDNLQEDTVTQTSKRKSTARDIKVIKISRFPEPLDLFKKTYLELPEQGATFKGLNDFDPTTPAGKAMIARIFAPDPPTQLQDTIPPSNDLPDQSDPSEEDSEEDSEDNYEDNSEDDSEEDSEDDCEEDPNIFASNVDQSDTDVDSKYKKESDESDFDSQYSESSSSDDFVPQPASPPRPLQRPFTSGKNGSRGLDLNYPGEYTKFIRNTRIAVKTAGRPAQPAVRPPHLAIRAPGPTLRFPEHAMTATVTGSQANKEEESDYIGIRYFIMDSGATRHMSGHQEDFISLTPCDRRIIIANNQEIIATGIGTICVIVRNEHHQKVRINLSEALYVPEMVETLLSVTQLIDNGNLISFGKDGGTITNEKSNLVIPLQKINKLILLSIVDDNFILSGAELALSASDITATHEEWHRRLGHMSPAMIKLLASAVTGLKISPGNMKDCDVCIKTKLTQQPFPSSHQKTTEPLQLIHSDVAGPINIESFGSRCKYAICFVDDRTRYAKLYLMRTKDECLDKFKEFIAHMNKLVPQHKIKAIRTDNGGEYISAEFEQFCLDNGIGRERTIPHTPQQNGVSERLWRTLFNLVRAMLKDANLTRRWWGRALLTATYLRNVSLTVHNKKITPMNFLLASNLISLILEDLDAMLFFKIWTQIPRNSMIEAWKEYSWVIQMKSKDMLSILLLRRDWLLLEQSNFVTSMDLLLLPINLKIIPIQKRMEHLHQFQIQSQLYHHHQLFHKYLFAQDTGEPREPLNLLLHQLAQDIGEQREQLHL